MRRRRCSPSAALAWEAAAAAAPEAAAIMAVAATQAVAVMPAPIPVATKRAAWAAAAARRRAAASRSGSAAFLWRSRWSAAARFRATASAFGREHGHVSLRFVWGPAHVFTVGVGRRHAGGLQQAERVGVLPHRSRLRVHRSLRERRRQSRLSRWRVLHRPDVRPLAARRRVYPGCSDE